MSQPLLTRRWTASWNHSQSLCGPISLSRESEPLPFFFPFANLFRLPFVIQEKVLEVIIDEPEVIHNLITQHGIVTVVPLRRHLPSFLDLRLRSKLQELEKTARECTQAKDPAGNGILLAERRGRAPCLAHTVSRILW